MANLFDAVGSWLGQKIAPYINDALGTRGNILANYYSGDHRPQLVRRMDAKTGKLVDDNITQNFVGLAVDRSVSRLFRGGVKFKLPEGASAQQEYLDRVWDLNKKEIILYQVGLHGAVYGTPYFKVSPDGLIDPYTGTAYPRLIPLDPEIVRIKTGAADMNDVQEYRIEYKAIEERDGRLVEVAHREITRKARPNDYTEGTPAPDTSNWLVIESEQVGSAAWVEVRRTEWPYDFPPILHWKNLPSLKSCYGDSDIDDAINVQDKSNFVVSNEGKIIKHHASPKTIITGVGARSIEAVDSAPDTMLAIPNPEAKAYNLEMQSDLVSTQAFAQFLRQSIFDIAREPDISSMADKVGQLTNFGLQVLWQDSIDKNDTKRQLYGDALKELNRRLLVLAGYEMEASNPGEIQWGNALPVDVTAEMTTDKTALELGIIDKETVGKRWQSRYGVEWETVQANLEKQQTQDNKNSDNIGAALLRNFNRGGAVSGAEQAMTRGGVVPQKMNGNGNKPTA